MKTEALEPPAGLPPPGRASRLAVFVRFWLPVLLWMSVIFTFSTEVGSTHHTSRFIGPFLRWLIPGVAEQTVGHVEFVVRKAGHMSEYAVLAILLWRARRQQERPVRKPWHWQDAAFALIVAALFAASDEAHQAFVPSREARVGDVALDATGAALGLLVLRFVGKRRSYW